jgi:hypothetical protein
MYQVRYGARPTVEEIATLADAVERAGQLISDNYANVTVSDGEGNEISGDNLIACYLGVMKLTSDLRVVGEHSLHRVMEISKEDFERLQQLEESLWRTEYRFDRAYMERTLAPDFLEFGRSRRAYTREDTLDIESHPIRATLPLPRFEVRLISADVALITYVSEVACGDEIETANRSSLWSRYPTGWRLRFHQGTPA